MDLQALKLTVGEMEANKMLTDFLPRDVPVQKLKVRLTPEGITVQGDYPTMMMKMSFETTWEVSGKGSKLQVRLANLKMAGVGAGMFRGLLTKAIKDATAQEPAIHVDGETVSVDLVQLAARKGIDVRLNMTSVRCEPGVLIIEAGGSSGTLLA